MCILPLMQKRLLGKSATWKEKFLRDGARFYDDITITHSDHEYFDKIYETKFNPKLCAEPNTKAQEAQTRLAKNQDEGQDGEPGGFRPMYYTHSYKSDPEKIDMSFDCANYQHQFRIDHDANEAPIPYEQQVLQSIFLNKTQRHL